MKGQHAFKSQVHIQGRNDYAKENKAFSFNVILGKLQFCKKMGKLLNGNQFGHTETNLAF